MVICKVNITFLLFEISLSLFLLANAEEDVTYTGAFSEELKSCDGFKNDKLIVDGLNTYIKDGNTYLKGKAILKEEIPEGAMITLSVWRVDGLVDEFWYTATVDFCNSVNEKSPFFALFDNIGQTKCPIAANTYDVNDMSFNMDDYQDYLNSHLCGEYRIEMSIMNGPEQLSCHIVHTAVEEHRQK